MTTKHLEQWSTFYNSNGYLCLVHKVQGGRGYVINYNKTFYSIKINNEDRPNYSPSILTADAFFTAYPNDVFYHKDEQKKFNEIKTRFYAPKKISKLLLLC